MTLLADVSQYPYGPEGRAAGWDGHAWDGRPVDAPAEPGVPVPHHGFLPFLRHRWFWTVVLGQVLVLVPAYLASSSDSKAVAALSAVGCAIFMTGAVMLVSRHLDLAGMPTAGRLIAWGIAAGTVGVIIAHTIEAYWLPRVVDFKGELWLAGPVEETSKLLVPVLLLAFGSAVFKDPRAGFLLTFVSGVTFGGIESVMYIVSLGSDWGHFFMGIVRPVSELGHPFWTALAGSLIWLGAWRRDRLVTGVGLVGYAAAMLQHSLHDGLPALAKGATSNSASYPALNGEFWTEAVFLFLFALLWAVVSYLILRHAARELVPPSAVAGNTRHWRPQIKAWGLPKD